MEWGPQCERDMHSLSLLEWVQGKATEMIENGGSTSAVRAERAGVQPGQEKASGRTLQHPCSTLRELRKKTGTDFIYSTACRDRTRSNGFRLKQSRFRLDI